MLDRGLYDCAFCIPYAVEKLGKISTVVDLNFPLPCALPHRPPRNCLGLSLLGVVTPHELVAVRLVLAGVDGGTNVVHQPDHELQVVHGAQRASEELLRLEQVVDVRAGVVLRNVAAELLVHAGEVALEAGRGEVHAPVQGVHAAAAPQAGRRDAVEGVRARLHGGEDVVRLGDAEQVARLVLG